MSVRIFGAGMAGLLAANLLRRYRPVVYEAQLSLPDNHGALLRFRSDIVARETGIPFRPVRVLKAVKSRGELRPYATLRDANLYSFKVTGEVAPRSILDLRECERYIAPPDFLGALARDAILHVNRPLTPNDFAGLADSDNPDDVIISTIPMPTLMQIVEWPNPPQFTSRSIWSVPVTFLKPLAVDVHQTIYYPDADVPYYRASITGNELIIEFVRDPLPDDERPLVPFAVASVLADFGLPPAAPCVYGLAKLQRFGKLVPIEDRVRQEFMMAMTDTFNLYSVGRFATWRQILLDDVVNDIRQVEKMFTQRSAYHRRLRPVSL